MAITDPTLDPVTGIPLDASYATQYQVPLGSQPINLDELNAQGKQGNWLYPDNLPPVVARLQARDLTNPGNAQDLSTDGQRNLNVNINALNPAVNLGGGGGGSPVAVSQIEYETFVTAFTGGVVGYLPPVKGIYGVSIAAWASGASNISSVQNLQFRLTAVNANFPYFTLCVIQLAIDDSGNAPLIPESFTNIRYPTGIIPPQYVGDPGWTMQVVGPIDNFEVWISIDYVAA